MLTLSRIDSCPSLLRNLAVRESSLRMKSFNNFEASILVRFGVRVSSRLASLIVSGTLFAQSQMTPLSLTGWNHDVIYEKTSSPSLSTVTSFIDSSGYSFAETGAIVPIAYKWNGANYTILPNTPVPFGLPTNRIVNSLATNSVTGQQTSFTFQDYTAANAALMKGGGDVVTLQLETPQRFSSLAFLNTSTGGDQGTLQTVRVTLNFQNDPTPVTFTYDSRAWRQTFGYPVPDPLPPVTMDTAIAYLDRVHGSGTNVPGAPDFFTLEQHYFGIYESDINLTSYGFDQKLITSISFEKVSNFLEADKYAAVFAVSGSSLGNRNDFTNGTNLLNSAYYQLAANSSIHRLPTANSDDVVISTASGPVLTISNANLTMGSLNLTSGSNYTIHNNGGSPSNLTLGTSSNSVALSREDLIYLGPNSGNLTIAGASAGSNLNLILTRTGNFDVANVNGTLDISAAILGSGFGMNKTGPGVVNLSGNNTFSGATTVTDGMLNAAASGALGGTSAIVIHSGGTLLLSGTDLDRVNDAASVSISDGGILKLGDSASTTSEMLGALTLSSGSILDFGSTLGDFTATFASLVLPGSGYATIVNWNGLVSQGFGSDTDRLLFSSISGATSTDAIRFDIGGTLHSARFVQLNESGAYEVLPNQTLAAVPEPTTLLPALAILGLAFSSRLGSSPRRRAY